MSANHKEDPKRNRQLFILFNIICWVVIFLLSFLMTTPNLQDGFKYAMLRLTIPASMCVMFYSNFSWLVPRFFITKQYRKFAVVNIVLIVVLELLVQAAMETMMNHRSNVPDSHFIRPEWPLLLALYIRNFLTIVLSGVIGVLLKLSMKWRQSEWKRHKMETEKAETELKLLSNQMKPHFLLNTLNNIYALVAIDQGKAQKAVMALSKMLRHLLYTDDHLRVNINDEVQLLESYVELMRIRQQKHVKIETRFEVGSASGIYVAPNIFISLVENAFKHGISATEESVVKVSLTASTDRIEFTTENSNFPKRSNDKSGHGIGLKQVERQLENSYGKNYQWIKEINDTNNIYISKIILYDTKMCNH